MPEDSTTNRERERERRERERSLLDLGLGDGEADEPAPSGILEQAGDSIGRYRLVKPLGSGGFGNVWLAEQTEPIHRKVALKLIKPGMDSREIVARFEAERQTLAMMDHPNIARVLDAGTSATSRPYFVLELAPGQPITAHCDRHRLSVRERLELFIAVCQAVHHAHQKGILHRDLKPSNILVAEIDGKVVPKVIDFGIAKALGANTEEALKSSLLATKVGVVVGTPNYMSPEQAGSTPDVDTRSDIYALGVIFYELLTGTTPLEAGVSGAAFDEVLRGIREVEPVRPSVYVGKAAQHVATQVSGLRHTDSSHLVRLLRGDLDWIGMTALEKDRRRRYPTVTSLAEDIQRHLNNETVSARPPSRLYQLQKLVARHKLWFAVYGIVVAALAAGLGIALWSLDKERRARQAADAARSQAKTSEQTAVTEAARSQAVTIFLKDMLFGADPLNSVALGGDTKVMRKILDETAKRIDEKLGDQPAVAAYLKAMTGQVYGSIGQYDEAERLLREALAFYRKSPAGNGPQMAGALDLLSLVHQRQAKWDEAEQEGREAVALQTRLDGEITMAVVGKKTHLAWTIVNRPGREGEAEEMFREALATAMRRGNADSKELLDARNGLGMVLSKQNKLDEAERLYRDSIDLRRRMFPGDHPYLAQDLQNLGAVLELKRKPAEAEELYRQCVAIRRKMLGIDHPDSDGAQMALVGALYAQLKEKEAADACRELLEIKRKRLGDKSVGVEQTLLHLVAILIYSGNDTDFEELAKEFPSVWLRRSEHWARRGKWTEAMAAAAKFQEVEPGDYLGYYFAALLFAQLGEHAEYEDVCGKIGQRFAGVTNPVVANRLAKACLLLPRPEADVKVAGALAAAAAAGSEKHLDEHSIQWGMALAEYRQGHWKEAIVWAGRAAESEYPYDRAEAGAIQAMAQAQLHEMEAARATLKKCVELVETQLPKLKDGDLGPEWWDWIIVHALVEEAKKRIEG